MDAEYEKLDLQTFYLYCRNTIFNHPETYTDALDNIEIVPSWMNTIDCLDVSLIVCDTMKTLNEITSTNEIMKYISALTEITIILNNIFYCAEKPYKKFWKDNTNLLYNQLIYPLIVYDNSIEIKQCNSSMDIEEYYHKYFVKFQEKCLKYGLTVDLCEYSL